MSREKLKIAVLYDVFEEEPEPAPPPEKPAKAKQKGKVRRKKKKDIPDREEIFDALVKLGHEPVYQVLDGRDQTLVAIARAEADLKSSSISVTSSVPPRMTVNSSPPSRATVSLARVQALSLCATCFSNASPL